MLQRMLGHASAALTVDRYGHLFPGQAQSVAERLDEKARLATPAGSPADLAGSATAALASLTSTPPLTSISVVVGTGIDPVTSRFSGARSTN